MILILLIDQLLACEFKFIYDQDKEGLSYDILQSEFTALGIWTRYYAFYLDISITKDLSIYQWGQIYEYRIITGFEKERKTLEYSLIKYPSTKDLHHMLIFEGGQDKQLISDDFVESYEGVWIFTYIGFDQHQQKIQIFLMCTKTDQIWEETYRGLQVDQISLSRNFSGQISFTQTSSDSVKFHDGEELKNYLKSCDLDDSCTQNKINNLVSGILTPLKNHINLQCLIIIGLMDGFYLLPLNRR